MAEDPEITSTSLPPSPTQLSGNCLLVWNHIAGQKIGRTKILGVWGQTAFEIARDLKMPIDDVCEAITTLQQDKAIYKGEAHYCTVTKGKWATWFPNKFGDKK